MRGHRTKGVFCVRSHTRGWCTQDSAVTLGMVQCPGLSPIAAHLQSGEVSARDNNVAANATSFGRESTGSFQLQPSARPGSLRTGACVLGASSHWFGSGRVRFGVPCLSDDAAPPPGIRAPQVRRPVPHPRSTWAGHVARGPGCTAKRTAHVRGVQIERSQRRLRSAHIFNGTHAGCVRVAHVFLCVCSVARPSSSVEEKQTFQNGFHKLSFPEAMH